MKKIILSLALLAGAAGAANAQIKYGVKGGFNGATFSGTDSKGSEYKAGFAAGAFLNFPITENVSVQPEFLYSQKGASVDTYQGLANRTLKSTVGYVDIPVLVRYTVGEDGKGLFFEGGPQGSLVVSNRDFFQTGGINTQQNENTGTGDLNKVVLGYTAGLGYQITSGLSVGLRYTGDITQVYKDGQSENFTKAANPGGTGLNPNVRNSVFQFQVGYAFGGK